MDLRVDRIVRATRSSASWLAVALALVLAPMRSLPAQATGTITGRVVETSSGMALQGVSVFASGTTAGALTRADGTYQFNVAPGRYEIRSRFLGYTGSSRTVTVADGATVTVDFNLDRAVSGLSEVVVLGSRSG